MSLEDLPRGTRALWGATDAPRRGPKPTMSVQSIAETVVALADRSGPDAATMAALAGELGYTTMALYRYVESRDDLLAAAMDIAYGRPPEPNRRLGWRRQLADWARAELEVILAHPWTLDVRLTSPPVTPNMLAWTDAGFATLARTHLGPEQVSAMVLVVDGFVRSMAQMARQYAAETTRSWGAQLREVVDADELPTLAGVLATGTLDDDPAEGITGEEFEFGLELLLDGIETRLGRG